MQHIFHNIKYTHYTVNKSQYTIHYTILYKTTNTKYTFRGCLHITFPHVLPRILEYFNHCVILLDKLIKDYLPCQGLCIFTHKRSFGH